MIELSFSGAFKQHFPDYRAGIITCDVINTCSDKHLWSQIDVQSLCLMREYRLDQIKSIPGIAATRVAYQKLGKDPNRYRPSAEALCRRIITNRPLNQINTVVDLINLVSMTTGFSIGGFDLSNIVGNLMLDIGNQGEVFEAIGRGQLNIHCLPVLRDSAGPIGTPTSDHERTKIKVYTSSVLLLINAYGGDRTNLEEAMELTLTLLTSYAEAKNIDCVTPSVIE